MTEIRVQATEYVVSALPEDDGKQGWSYGTSFDLTVAYRGNDRWAVIALGRCLDINGEWSHESSPSNRTDEWLATHRFDLTTAIELAKRHVEDVKINGYTVADVRAQITEAAD
jgi:hypothetical protein